MLYDSDFVLSCQMFAPPELFCNQLCVRINGDPYILMLSCLIICFVAFKTIDSIFLSPSSPIPFSLFCFRMIWVPDITYEIPVLVKETKDIANDSLIEEWVFNPRDNVKCVVVIQGCNVVNFEIDLYPFLDGTLLRCRDEGFRKVYGRYPVSVLCPINRVSSGSTRQIQYRQGLTRGNETEDRLSFPTLRVHVMETPCQVLAVKVRISIAVHWDSYSSHQVLPTPHKDTN